MKIRCYILLMLMAACAAQASFITEWTGSWAGGVTTITDTLTVTAPNYRDVREVNHYDDGSNFHYFRLVLEGGSGTELIGGATDYMINIDSIVGGQSGLTSDYLALGLTGIDQIIDSHMGTATSFSSAIAGHNHIASVGANGANVNFTLAGFTGAAIGNDFQGGESFLEWKVNKSILPETSFRISGSSLTIGGSAYNVTADAGVVPEPATAGLLVGAGLFIAAYRRIKKPYAMA